MASWFTGRIIRKPLGALGRATKRQGQNGHLKNALTRSHSHVVNTARSHLLFHFSQFGLKNGSTGIPVTKLSSI